MKKSLKFFLLIFLSPVALLAAMLAFFEFYVWKSHDFSSEYQNIQACIELGGVWNDKANNCKASEDYQKWKQKNP